MSNISVKNLLEVAPLLPAEASVLIRGDHGIGKSQVVRQIAATLGLPVIDRRLSQMSEGDIIGLPSTDGDVTRFNPPDWYRQACRTPVCLFLDEFNRSTNEVQQAGFQIVLDRELNGCKLHPETRVYAAVNVGSAYTVNEMDPALIDRFWVVDLKPTVADWVSWARGRLADVVVDFIAQNEKWLDPPKNANPGEKHVSRRSWERLDRALKAAGVLEAPGEQLFHSVCTGFIGTPATIDFVAFAKSVEGRFTGEEIINDYDKVRPRLKKLKSQDRWNAATEKAGDYIACNLERLSAAQQANLRAFAKDLPAELRVVLWSKISSQGRDKLDLTRDAHKAINDLVVEAFAKKDGEKGKK